MKPDCLYLGSIMRLMGYLDFIKKTTHTENTKVANGTLVF